MHGLRDIATFTMRGGGKYTGNSESSSGIQRGFMKKVASDINIQLNKNIPIIFSFTEEYQFIFKFISS